MSTVTATYTDAQGNPASGTVYLSPAARAGVGQPPDIVTEKRVWADLDEQGRISIDVIPSDDPGWLIDGQMPYLVEERLMGLPFRSYWIGVPDAGVDLSAVQHADPDVAPMPVPGPQGPPGTQGPEGPQGPPGEDFTPADADARYVNATGDTMTGPLIVDTGPSAANFYLLSDTDQYIRLGTDALIYRSNSGELLRLQVEGVERLRLGRGLVDTRGTPIAGGVPAAAQHVPRLARTPNPATGDLGLPGFAGSDTGWRDIATLIAPSWQAGAQSASVRRVGNSVYLRMNVNHASGGGTETVVTLPTGLRFATAGYAIGWGSSAHAVTMDASGAVRALAAQTGLRWALTWTTDDPWPTSLPGTEITAPATWS